MTDERKQNVNEEFLDALLERALQKRGEADARPGLETRILAGVRAEKETPSVTGWGFAPWMRWAMGVGVAAVLVFTAFVYWPKADSGKQIAINPPEIKKKPLPEPVNPSHTENVNGAQAATVHTTKPKGPEVVAEIKPTVSPRLATFPSPSPLTEQEKLLLLYYKRTPREELIAQSRPDPPPNTTDGNNKVDDNKDPNESRQRMGRESNGQPAIKN